MNKTMIKLGMNVGLLLAGGGVLAAPSPTDSKTQSSDQQFLAQDLGVNQLELQLGQLAMERATKPDVKAMAEKMVVKHTELGKQLSELDRKSGGSGRPKLSSEQQATFERVKSQAAGTFDSVFKEVVDTGHVKELAMYQDEANRATSSGLRDFAQRRAAQLKAALAPKEPEPKQEW